MMKEYVCSEWIKHKRTFAIKLVILAPVITLLMNVFAPMWYQQNSFNWWYVLLFPGFLTLLCTMCEQRDGGKLKYRSLIPLPIKLENAWIAKAIVILILDIIANFIFLGLNMLGGIAVYFIYEIPISISLFQAATGIFCIIVASMWEIPICLWLSKKIGAFAAVVINAGIGSVLGVLFANTKYWILCPYSWMPRLMVPTIGILPNGVPVSEEAGYLPVSFVMVMLALLVSVVLFSALIRLGAKGFSRQEVR